MSFLAALERDFKIVGKAALMLAPYAGAAVGVVDPPLGALITGIAGQIQNAVIAAEKFPGADGPAKQQLAVDSVMNALAIVTDLTGKSFTVDQDLLKRAVDLNVAYMNALAALKASAKTE